MAASELVGGHPANWVDQLARESISFFSTTHSIRRTCPPYAASDVFQTSSTVSEIRALTRVRLVFVVSRCTDDIVDFDGIGRLGFDLFRHRARPLVIDPTASLRGSN